MTENAGKSIRWFEDLSSDDVSSVGGKNASLGEMISALQERGVRVPNGFATTADAYRRFLSENDITDRITDRLSKLKRDNSNLESVGKDIRRTILSQSFPDDIEADIREAYGELSRKYNAKEVSVAVRSSATAEDLPEASFAGQQDTFLNVSGENELLKAVRRCYASLFTDRAIAYREDKGFEHMKVALSAGIQRMVRADTGGAGVMFTLDTETGFRNVIVINAAWGLGETVVQGTVNPDEYVVFKPHAGRDDVIPIVGLSVGTKRKKMVYASGKKDTKTLKVSREDRLKRVLSDDDVMQLARWAVEIENHYDQPMDLEWAKDGESGDLFILQARPETVQSQKEAGSMKSYQLMQRSEKLVQGLAIGEGIAAGKAQLIASADDIDKFKDDAVLVTGQTDPDWVPIMKRAAAIVTDHGGRTSHAAIVSRELGIPAVVGCENATDKINDGADVTVSCSEGDQGFVYTGRLDYRADEVDLTDIPETRTHIRMNIASPSAAFRWWRLPAKGIGLARMEFIINNVIKVHPKALLNFDTLKDKDAKKTIDRLTARYKDKAEFFIDNLARGIASIAAAQYPHQVLVRTSDFKTNEYADLIGGAEFEHEEDNPMLGFRGASRYYSDRYRDAFALECRAITRAREEIGMDSVAVMIPFCRTLEEADRVLETMAEFGLVRGSAGLQVYVMAEIPSNIILADQFGARFDGFSIGSNDLTQLILGVDRDSEELSHLFDEQNEAVKRAITDLIQRAHACECEVSICGQAPSDHPAFAEFLVKAGIDSISLNPDSVVEVKRLVARLENGER